MSKISLPQEFCLNPKLHAYLYLSEDAATREKGAFEIAKAMLCRSPKDNAEGCGECDCCKKINAGSHPDCIVNTDGGKMKVDTIRTLSDEAYLATNEADAKVFILCDANLYNQESQNAMLKIIEEPPKGVKFILTAAHTGGLLPTVRSRVCALSANKEKFDGVLMSVTKEKSGISKEDAFKIAHLIYAYDGLDIKSLDCDAVLLYIKSATEIFTSPSENTDRIFLKKSRDELELCLRVLMLASRELAVSKCTGDITEGILTREEISSVAAKCSMKRIHALYDVFETAFLLASENNANANALAAYIMRKIR